MTGRCSGKVALVTGASRGLGKAIALRLAAEGAAVALTARTVEPTGQSTGSLRETLDEIRATGGRGAVFAADLSDEDARTALVEQVGGELGAPDILINNAAVTFLRDLADFPVRRMRLMLEMHVVAPHHLIQMVTPSMRRKRSGWILNITSVAGVLPSGPPYSEFDTSAGFGVYGTVKAAQDRLTGSWAAELYSSGIAVNSAAPWHPVPTPGASTLDLGKDEVEDVGLITETAMILCTGDPSTETGQIAYTQPFLRERGLLV